MYWPSLPRPSEIVTFLGFDNEKVEDWLIGRPSEVFMKTATLPDYDDLQYYNGAPLDRAKAVVIMLFMHGCPSCAEAFPILSKLWSQHPNENIQIIAITSKGEPEELQAYVEELSTTCDMSGITVAKDLSKTTSILFKASNGFGIPRMLMYDRAGKIVHVGLPNRAVFNEEASLWPMLNDEIC
ncbi:hypothetical protein HDV05_001077 [Chytridiales sp. JEL 0842]|nr:hypothetical protein HDV05_001077 [Chytridiales sp. JEL 0842]